MTDAARPRRVPADVPNTITYSPDSISGQTIQDSYLMQPNISIGFPSSPGIVSGGQYLMPASTAEVTALRSQVTNLKAQVDMLQNLVDTLMADKKTTEQMIKKALGESSVVQEYIAEELLKLRKEEAKKAREDLSKIADRI